MQESLYIAKRGVRHTFITQTKNPTERDALVEIRSASLGEALIQHSQK